MKFYKNNNFKKNENRFITHNQLVKIMSYKSILKTNVIKLGDEKVDLTVDSLITLSFNDASELIECVENYIEKNIENKTTEKTISFN